MSQSKEKISRRIHHLLCCCGHQVRDGAMSCLVEIYKHVGERVRMDLSKKGLPQSRYANPSLSCLLLPASILFCCFLFVHPFSPTSTVCVDQVLHVEVRDFLHV